MKCYLFCCNHFYFIVNYLNFVKNERHYTAVNGGIPISEPLLDRQTDRQT